MPQGAPHAHVFLGRDHAVAERRARAVVALCVVVMVIEIAGGLAFGSIALVADGLHMSTHAGALMLAALAYRFARRHAADPRFTFGTGKVADLAGFTSAVVLAMIALLIAWEACLRLAHPVPIAFAEALPIACLGLAVNLASAWLLGAAHHHDHDHDHDHHAHGHHGHAHHEHGDDARHARRDAHIQRDNNMRSAVAHVLADAAVSVLVIAGLLLARGFGWLWMDAVAALVGSAVIAAWSWSLIRASSAVLLDMDPDPALADTIRRAVESEGDRILDLHLWRLGPGHLGAVLSIETARGRLAADYHARLAFVPHLSHLTVEVQAA